MSAARRMGQRLLVFRYVKAWMEDQAECPTAVQVSRETNIPAERVQMHMRALRGADGLPAEIPTGAARRRAVLRGVTGRANTKADMMVPVDAAIRHSSRSKMMDALEAGWDSE